MKARDNTSGLFFKNYQLNDNYIKNHRQFLLESITRETEEHCSLLESMGLADRACHFKVRHFIERDLDGRNIDISRLSYQMSLPDAVHSFNPDEKNTLFVNPEYSQQQEIENTLQIRLYPVIRRIIKRHGAEIFLGSRDELQIYSTRHIEKLVIEIEVPSSVKFYIAIHGNDNIKVYISGLVSHENLIQLLITLKLAGIDLQGIPIHGTTKYFESLCRKDLTEFEKQSTGIRTKRNVLIVAGCGLEDTVCTTLEQMFSGTISRKKFCGDLVSLSYIHSKYAPNIGFIVLNLNYGEICEVQISTIFEKFNCIGIFSGSAAGYIPVDGQNTLPEIGDRLTIHSARHYSGEVVSTDRKDRNLHLQVPTIFVETFKWLEQAREAGGTTVDVETFYILRAVYKYLQENPSTTIHTDIGVFISDYVGEKPLRSYRTVFAQYPEILQNFVKKMLVANLTPSYSNNQQSIPAFSRHFASLKPEKMILTQEVKNEAVVDTIGKLWDKSEFSRRVHTPVAIGTVKNRDRFITKTPRCLHLPIKLPKSDIRIPFEYQCFMDELQQIFNFEVSVNPGWDNLYAYLTVDQSFVPRANTQRVPGPHVDGIPRDRKNPQSQLIDHAYLVTDAIPTMFYAQKFDMAPYDPEIHHYFAIFRALSDESRTIRVKPFEIVLMNAYSVHTPTHTMEDVNRTFIRLEFSTLQFDRAGNSVNPHFCDGAFPDYPFKYIPRPIPQHLFVPPGVYLNKPVTNEDYLHESIESFGRANLRAVFTGSNQFKLKQSNYKNLEVIAQDMMNEEIQGMVLTYQGMPHAFCLYRMFENKIRLETLFTLTSGNSQEIMLLQMNILKKIAEKNSIRAGQEEGDIAITIVVNENNENMLPWFLRAARLSKLEATIEREECIHMFRMASL